MTRSEATRALFPAAADGDLAAARQAVRDKADLEARNDERQTPLVVATKAKQTKVAVLLLEAGADPDAKDDLRTPRSSTPAPRATTRSCGPPCATGRT